MLRIGTLFIGAFVLASCSPVTYGTGTPTTRQTVEDFAGILAFGDRPEQIVYEERPDLVIPPTNELPAPTDPVPDAPAAPIVVVAADPCQWWQYGWSEFGADTQEALGRLGWTEANWQSPQPETWPASAASNWDGLRNRQRNAAESLGFTQASWDSCGLP
jgi:hypothetical protein